MLIVLDAPRGPIWTEERRAARRVFATSLPGSAALSQILRQPWKQAARVELTGSGGERRHGLSSWYRSHQEKPLQAGWKLFPWPVVGMAHGRAVSENRNGTETQTATG